MHFCLCLLSAVLSTAPAGVIRVRHVEVVGNFRIPQASILGQVSARPEHPFDAAVASYDVSRLYRMGYFENVEIDSREAGPDYVDVIYRVKEFPFVSGFDISGIGEALGGQIREFIRKQKLDVSPAAPFNPALTNKVALGVRDYLRGRKYPNAIVQILPERNGGNVWVHLGVRPGPKVEVGAVRFVGNQSIPSDELRREMKMTRAAPFWARWGGAGRYLPDELTSDTNNLLRCSVGGELRLQVPLLRQPARVTFAWNPLRLNGVSVNSSSPLHLADRRGTVRFALGSLF